MYEIEMMQEAGMSALQIIQAGTRNAAAVIGLGDQLGTLEPGKIADILIVEGDPLTDLAHSPGSSRYSTWERKWN